MCSSTLKQKGELRRCHVCKQTHSGRSSVTFRRGTEEVASKGFTNERGSRESRRFFHSIQVTETQMLTCASKLRVRSQPFI